MSNIFNIDSFIDDLKNPALNNQQQSINDQGIIYFKATLIWNTSFICLYYFILAV